MSTVPPFGPLHLMLEAPSSPTLALLPGPHTQRGAAEVESETEPTDTELLDQMSAELDEVEAALARLDDGAFDTCQVCGSRIEPGRLLEEPLLTRCAAHS